MPVSGIDIIDTLNVFTPEQLALISKINPTLYQRITGTMGYERETEDKEACEEDLITFMMAAWEHIGEPPGLNINWHHEVIAEYLMAQARGEFPALILNQPPRSTKTTLASICLPSWVWIQPKERWNWLMGPHVQFFCLSYGATLAEEIAVKHRRLVQGEWYQRRWGDRVKIRDDQAARNNFGTTMGGARISNSIEGGILGRGGIWQIVDDPHHVKGAESDNQRRETIDGMRSLSTRLNNPTHAARTLIMQRLHEDDATNYCLENWDRPKHLMFPMEFDPLRAIPEDPRTEEDELLWPAVWTRRAVENEKKELTEYGVAGQLQQSPIPRGGGIIKRQWWRLWPDDAENEADFMAQYKCYACGWEEEMPPCGLSIDCARCGLPAERRITYPEVSFSMLSVDTAYSEQDQLANSWNAVTRLGIWHDRWEAPRIMLMEMWRGRPPLTSGIDVKGNREKGLVDIVHEMAIRGRVDLVLIERKTRGVDLYHELEQQFRTPNQVIEDLNTNYLEAQIAEMAQARTNPWRPGAKQLFDIRMREQKLRQHYYSIDFFEPTGRGDKVARLTSCVPMFTNDLVWAPAKKWADVVIDEVNSAPRATFNDLTDTVTAGLIYVRENGLLRMKYEHDQDKRREEMFKASRQTAGASVRDQYEEA